VVAAHFLPVPLNTALWAGSACTGLAALAHFRVRHAGIAARIGGGAAVFFAGMALLVGRPDAAPRVLSVPDNSLAIFHGCVIDPALVGADRERFGV